MKKRFMRLMSVLTCVTMITQSSVGMIPVYAQPDDGQVQETQEVEDALSFGDEDVEASDDISVEYEEASDQEEVLSSGDDEEVLGDDDVVAEDEETSADGDEESSQPMPDGEGVEVVGGYIETPWDNNAQVVDDDLDYDEALEMMVDDPDDEEDSLGENVPDPVKYVEEPSTIESKYPTGTDSEALAYLKNTFPANRSQSPYGSCWAHAAISLTEFYMVKHGLKDNQGTVDKSVNYSELQLAYFCYNKAPDPVNGSTGDKITYYNDKGSKDSFLNFGGSIGYAAQSLMRYNGVTDDAGAAAYSNASAVLSNGLSDEYARSKDVAHLKNVYLLSITENPKLVKQAIKENGIVGVSMYADRNYLNSSTSAYYCTEAKANHAVAIVGWNDDYPASNFKTNPGSNGAWLVRNSWTTNVEYSYYSYFWLSYKDKSLSDTAYVFEMADNDKDEFYDNNYNYDSQLHSTSSVYGSSKSANVFTVVNPSETLKAVQFDSSMIAPGNYTVEIYKNLKHSGNPESGTKIDEATTTGTIPFSGSFTIPLKSSVDLYQGEMFSVVITAECGLDRERDHVWLEQIDMDVSINAGESFIYKNSTWNDLSNDSYGGSHGNFCIRALTNTNGGASIPDKITNLSVKSVNEQSVTLIWSASLDAEGYEVWSSKSENGTYTKVGETSASERQYKHSNLDAGTVYYYKVYPIKNKSRYDAGVSYVVSARTNAAIPKVEIVKVGKYTADIRWDALENCDGYEYKYGTGTSYYGPNTLTANEVRLDHLNPGQEFWVEVRSYVEDGDNRTLSDAERVTFTTESGQGSAVTNLKAVPYSETSVKLSWDGTDEAGYYNVYKSEDGINYTNVGIATDNERTVWSLDSSIEYYFKVAAVYNKFGYDTDSIDSEVVRSYTGLPTVVLGQPTYENGSIKVNWEAASGVKYYAVYRLEYSTAQYEPLALVEDALTYTDEDVLPGTRYSYQVHACRSNVMRDDQGLSYTASISIPLDRVKDLTITNITQRGATLSWSAIRGAQGYIIEEYDSYSGKYTELDRIGAENTTYTLNCFVPNTLYSVYVTPYTDYYHNGTSGSNSWFKTLAPGPADASLFTLSDKTATYDGLGHSVTVVSSDEETENKGYDVYYGKVVNGRVSSYSADLPVYAGDYKIKINTKDTAYYTATTDITDDDWVLTIEPKTVGLNWSNTEFGYDGKSHVPTVTLTGVLSKDTCSVTVTGEATDAGTHTATASSLSNINYQLPADRTKSFSIAKAVHDNKTDAGSARYGQTGTVDLSAHIAAGASIKANGISVTDVYNVLALTPSVNDGVLSFTFVRDIEKVDNSATVLLTVDGGKNYEDYTITVTVTVLDKPEQKVTFISPTTSIVSKTYGNRDFYISASAEGGITYTSSDTSVATVGQSDGKVHIVGSGEVTITANAAETSDYAPGSASFVLNVNKKTIGITWSNTSFTYDKTSKLPTATATGLVGNDVCILTVDGAKTNAGEYEAVVTGLDNVNYELPEELTCSYEIKRRPVTISGLSADDKDYDGTKDALITGDAALEGKIEGDDLFVAPGSAYFVSADAGENIRVYFEGFGLGGDDKDNYVLPAQPSYVTANIRKLSMSVTAEDVEETYDGFDHGIDVLVVEPYQGYEIKYGTRSGRYNLNSCPTISDVGTLTVYYKVSAANYEDFTGAATVKINTADADLTAPAALTLDYAGTDQELVSEGSSEDGTIEYSTDNSKWSTTVPTGKDVGTYDVWWRFTGDKNHNSLGSTKLTSKINKKALTVTPDAGQSKVFGSDDPALTYTVSGLAGSDTKAVVSGSLKRENGDKVGEYEISNDNLTSENYDITVTSGVKFAITPKAITGARVMLEKSQLEYNGSEQSVVVTGVKLTDQTVLDPDDYEISGDITGVNKGSYTVTVTGKGNYSGIATTKWAITDKPMTVAAEDVTETYDGSSYGINVVVTDPADGYEIKYGTKEGTYNLDDCPTITDAGTLTVYYKVSADNYEPYEGWAIITVNPADADVTAPTALTLDYDGTYQALLSEGGSEDGTIEYSTDNIKWSSAVPTVKDAGTYDVWWRFTGDKNHNSLGTAKLTSKINKITLTVTPDEGQSKVFGEDDPVLTYAVSGLVGNDTKAVISGCLMRETGENVGEYEISDDNIAADNYDITVTSGVRFTITQKSITDAAVVLDNTQFIYDETEKNVNLIKVEMPDGVILDPDEDYTVSGNMSGKAIGDYTVTVTGKGNYKDETVVDWYIVEEIKTMDVTVDTIRTTYDGMAHDIGLRIDEPSDGYTIKYENESGVFEKTDAPVITDAGTLNVSFVISAKGYEDYYGEATVIIEPASVTVKADDKSKTEGDNDPEFTATVTGLIGSVSENKIEFALSREEGETPGTYTITPKGDELQGNYAVTYETGTFTIFEKKDDSSSSSGKDSSSSSSDKDSSSSSGKDSSSSSSGKDSSSSSSDKDSSSSSGKDSSSSSSGKDSSSSSSEKDSSSSSAKPEVTVSMDTVDGTQVKTVTFNNDVAVKQKLDVSAYVGVHKKYMVYPKGYAKVSKKTMLITPKKPGDITIIACDKENKVWVPKEIITLKADSTRVVEKTIDAVISEGIIDGKLNIEDGALTPDRWESSKPEVAKVDEKTGMITPVSEGKTTIIAYYGTGKNAAKVKFKVKVWDL